MCQCCGSGLLYLHGPDYKLMHISLQGNHLDNIDHILQCLLGLQGLREVILSQYDRDNPVCRLPGMALKAAFELQLQFTAGQTQLNPEMHVHLSQIREKTLPVNNN